MFNNLTFGCSDFPIRVNGLGFIIHTGGLLEKELSKEVIRKALAGLPEEILHALWEFNQRHPVVVRQGTLTSPKEAAFYPFTESFCGMELTLSFIRKRISPSAVYHELVHYAQWRRGDIQATGETGTVKWKGEVHQLDLGISLAYLATPWEQEAYLTQFEWEKDTGRTHLDPATKMRIAKANILFSKFMGGIGGNVLFGLVFLVLLLAVSSTGWLMVKGFLGFNALNQGLMVLWKLWNAHKERKGEMKVDGNVA